MAARTRATKLSLPTESAETQASPLSGALGIPIPQPSSTRQQAAQEAETKTQPETAEKTSDEKYTWDRQSIAETFQRIVEQPEYPWVAIGDFLDDWRRSAPQDRLELVVTEIAFNPTNLRATNDQNSQNGHHSERTPSPSSPSFHQWAAFCAATVEWLCWESDLAFPAWTSHNKYTLKTPWFLYPGDLLRAWQLATTPAPFKARNIFGGDEMLSRV